MSVIEIRYALLSDAGLIADISRQTFSETFADSNTTADMEKFLNEQFTREALMEEVSEPGSIFLLAFADGEPAGYVRKREGESYPEFEDMPAIEIARIYALKKMIGKGVGSALMQACISIAIENRRRIIWLGVWERNERAIAFYRKWGFEKFSGHDFVLGNDIQHDWLMMKYLP